MNDEQLKERLRTKIDLIFKRVYIVTGNIYAWFWLFREIFFRDDSTFEGYLLWFFLTFGFYLFIQNNDEVFFKTKDGRKV